MAIRTINVTGSVPPLRDGGSLPARVTRILVVATLLIFGSGVDAAARSCVYMGPLCSRWQDYDAIFDGTVTSIRRVDREETFGGRTQVIGDRLVTFRVHDRWKGADSAEIELRLSGGYEIRTSSDFHVDPGKRYVIFARYFNGQLATSSCDPSTEQSRAGELLAFLKSLREAPKGGRIFGRVQHGWLPLQPAQAPPPLVTTTVTLSHAGGSKTVSPTDGHYDFSGLAPGAYSISAAPVEHLTGHSTRDIQLADARACAQVDFTFAPDTSINGQVLHDDGKPAAGARVEIARADSWQKAGAQTVGAAADGSGHFSIRGVPPGNYIVALNLRDAVSYNPYPRRLYTDAAGVPEVVRVGPGQHVGLSVWRVGRPLAQIRLRARLVDAGGTAHGNTAVSLLDVTNPELPWAGQYAMGSRTDAAGFVEFDVRESRRYVIEHRRERTNQAAPRSQVFTVEPNAPPVVLVLPKR